MSVKPSPHQLAICASLLLSGCSTLTSPREQPVIEDKVGEHYSTLAVTAERRVVIFGRVKPGESSPDKGGSPVVCAEPSPDVAESLVASLKVIAEVSAKKGADEAKAGAEFGRSIATAISTLFVRSQGIQFLRDSSYALCQAHINGLIDKPAYAEALKDITRTAAKLIEKEIPSLEARRIENAVQRAEKARDEAAQSAQNAKAEAQDAKRSAEKLTAAQGDKAKSASTEK